MTMLAGASAHASERWAPGPACPRLAEGAVHVWRAELTTLAEDLPDALSQEERARAARVLDSRKGSMWARARCLLRVLLGRYLEVDPGVLPLAAVNGKPVLLGGGAAGSQWAHAPRGATAAEISFNPSHSRQLAMYAFSKAGEVGIDVEMARAAIDELGIARRAFGPREARRLRALEPLDRRRAFLRGWTRHEAKLKCRGGAMGGGPVAAVAQEPWITELDAGPDAAAALAVEREPTELCCWEWTG